MALPSDRDTKFWLALLHEIDLAGGIVDVPASLYPKLRQYFPLITDDDLILTLKNGGNKWTNRIQWVRQHLVYCGCLDSTPRVWKLTDIGRGWLQAQWRGPMADYSRTLKPPAVFGPQPEVRGKIAAPFKDSSKRAHLNVSAETAKPLFLAASTVSKARSQAVSHESDQISAANSVVILEADTVGIDSIEYRKANREHTEIQYLLQAWK